MACASRWGRLLMAFMLRQIVRNRGPGAWIYSVVLADGVTPVTLVPASIASSMLIRTIHNNGRG
jgi:hypothetical protein